MQEKRHLVEMRQSESGAAVVRISQCRTQFPLLQNGLVVLDAVDTLGTMWTARVLTSS